MSRCSLLWSLLLAGALAPEACSQEAFDLLVRGGQLLDGSGAPARAADVGIRAGRIAALGELPEARATTVLDASGCCVAPGFIDLHTHADSDVVRAPTAANFVRMGVTTLITGNCGRSVPDLAAHFARLERSGLGFNYGSLVGHSTVRQAVLGLEYRPPAAEELARMQQLVDRELRAGAFGLSTGLIYVPGTYATTEELIALARVVAGYGGVYATHMRNEGDQVLDSIAEALRIGEEAEVAVHISHVKATGRPNWGRSREILALLDRARAEGRRVTADQYAYDASSTGLDVLFPAEALAVGRAEFGRRLLEDEGFRRAMHQALRAKMDQVGLGDFAYARIAHAPGNADLDGLTLKEAAQRRLGRDDPDAQSEMAMALFAASKAQRVSMVYHTMAEEDVAAFLQTDWIAVASDAGVRALDAAGKPHPRGAGNTVRVLGRYVREQGILDLPTAVRKMTSVPARAFGIHDRGELRPGACADLVVFDPAVVADRATFAEPTLAPEGVRWVLVNGVVVVASGAVTGARPGQVLRAGGAPR